MTSIRLHAPDARGQLVRRLLWEIALTGVAVEIRAQVAHWQTS